MKNKTSIFTLLLGAMIILASCNSEEIPGVDLPAGDNMPIEFSGVQTWVDTKISNLPESFTQFKVWASRTSEELDQPDYRVFGDGTEVEKEIVDELVTWKYSPVRYWQPGEYNFYAVSPAAISESIPIHGNLDSSDRSLYFGEFDGEKYSGWDLSSNQVDLLEASKTGVTTRLNSTNTPVDLTFEHMLSKISFSLANKSRDYDIIIYAIKIYGNTKIATEFSEGAFILDSKTDSENSFINNDDMYIYMSRIPQGGQVEFSEIVSAERLVFPEECEITVELTISLDADASGYTKSSASTSVKWESGKHYHYQVKIGPDNISFIEPRVVDWNIAGDADSEDIIM